MLYLALAVVALAIVSFVLLVYEDRRGWLTAALMAALVAWASVATEDPADFALQLFFMVSAFAGWRYWGQGGRISALGGLERLYRALTALGLWALFSFALALLSPEPAPLVHAAFLALNIVGQVLLIRKRLESWYVWMLVYVFGMVLYFLQGRYPEAALFSLFFLLSTAGAIEWNRRHHKGLVERAYRAMGRG
jgi:nicotinamide mononucleotide transporter